MAKPRPLITRLRAARTLLRTWRKALHDSHVITAKGHPRSGQYEPPEMAAEMARFDEALQTLTEAIREEVKGPAMRPGRGLTTCDMGEDESL